MTSNEEKGEQASITPASFSEVMEQYRQENSYSHSDIFFKSNNNNETLLCIACKKVKINPSYTPYCGPMCKDYHQSKTKYELKGLLVRVEE